MTTRAELVKTWTYPPVRRDETFKEVLHGREVPDPYRWLEDPDSEETKAFVEAQNEITFGYVNKDKNKGSYKEKLTALYDYERFGCPFRRGNYYYFSHNTGLQQQSVLYRQKSLEDEKMVFFDPNVLEADGTAALSTYAFTETGNLFSYAISRSGSDWSTIHVRCAETTEIGESGHDLDDVIEWVKFSTIVWTHDDAGFFYMRFPKPSVDQDKAGTDTGSNLNAQLYYHRLGKPQSEDQLILCDPENPEHMFGADVSQDGRWLLVQVARDCDPINKFWIYPLGEGGRVPENLVPQKIVDNFDASYDYITNEGDHFYFMTNSDAPRYKVVTYNLKEPEKGFVDFIPQHDTDVLNSVRCVAENHLFVEYMHDVKSTAMIYSLKTGEKLRNLPVPIGSIGGITGRRKDRELFFSFLSFLNPGVIYRYNVDQDQLSEHISTKLTGFDPSKYETHQEFVESKDGVKFPIFITARKDVKLDGTNPALLYGYGGFSNSVTPSFSPGWATFLEYFKGVLVTANLRGGCEYGESWHKEGSLHKKQNVFDDFQSAASYICRKQYTHPSKIIIQGGSNGGLLVGACINQAPQLFGCGLAAVGVMDMLRFHKFTIGHAWISDYGNPENKEDFDYIIKYSPLHNVDGSKTYPALLLTTSDHDDRVAPLHSFKLIAELQHQLPNNPNPLMARIETKAGHGAGKPTAKRIDEWVDQFAFFSLSLGLKWHA